MFYVEQLLRNENHVDLSTNIWRIKSYGDVFYDMKNFARLNKIFKKFF